MRLWCHQILPHLPTQWLLGQHRECTALRGFGWGRKHATVNFVWKHSPAMLAAYHRKVIIVCRWRKIKIDLAWVSTTYRGKKCDSWPAEVIMVPSRSYPQHDYDQCARDIVDLEHKLANPDKWKLLSREDLRRLRHLGIWLPVTIGG